MTLERCGWATSDPLYLAYHDSEWGVPCFQSRELFAMLCLEAQQAGLSWITVLKKGQYYRQCFYDFEPKKVAEIGQNDVEMLMQDSGIIRNRSKIEAIIANAQAYMTMEAKGEDFTRFIWSFVDGNPQINYWKSLTAVPVSTPVAAALSNALKKKGFKFIGPTICYAFMQACGLVNDHVTTCFCHPENRTNYAK